MNTIEDQQRFIELRAKNYSFDKIAQKMKKSKPTLIEWNKRLEVEIANQRAIEIEALLDQYLLTVEARFIRIGKILTRIEKEIEKVDLTKLSARELLDFYLKYLQLAGVETEKLELLRKQTEESKIIIDLSIDDEEDNQQETNDE